MFCLWYLIFDSSIPPTPEYKYMIWEWRGLTVRIHFPLSFSLSPDWATVAHNLHTFLGKKKKNCQPCAQSMTLSWAVNLDGFQCTRQDLLHSTSCPFSIDGTSSLGVFSLRFHLEVISWEPAHCLGSSWGAHTCSGSLDPPVLSRTPGNGQRWNPSSWTQLSFSAFLPSFYSIVCI